MNDGLDVYEFNKKNKELDVPQFKSQNSKSTVNMNYVNKHAVNKVSKRKINLKGLAMIVTIVGGFTMIGTKIYNRPQYEQVEHKYDTYVDGMIQHNHELNRRHFVQDYKIVNEKATDKDVLDAIYDGQYKYYVDHQGLIKIEKDLQGKSMSNDDVIAFSEDFLEEHGGKSLK